MQLVALEQYISAISNHKIPTDLQREHTQLSAIKNKFVDIEQMWFPMDSKDTWMSLSCPWQASELTVCTRHDHNSSALVDSQLCSARVIQDTQKWNETEMHSPMEFQQVTVSLLAIPAKSTTNHPINSIAHQNHSNCTITTRQHFWPSWKSRIDTGVTKPTFLHTHTHWLH